MFLFPFSARLVINFIVSTILFLLFYSFITHPIYAQEDTSGGDVTDPGDFGTGSAGDVTVDPAAQDYGDNNAESDCPGCSPSNTPPSLGDPATITDPPWTGDDPSDDPRPPGRPRIDNPSLACSTQNQPLIEFDIFPAVRADWYEVYRRDESGNESLRRSWGAMLNGKLRFISGTLTPGVKYNYYLKAYNRDMPDWQAHPSYSIDPDTGSEWVGWLTARTDCGPSKPAPIIIQNSCRSTYAPLVTLRWDQTINTTYYEVYYQEPGQTMVLGGNNIPFTASGGTSPPYMNYDIAPGLSPSKSYRFAVVAHDAFNHATWSDWTAYNLTLDCAPPAVIFKITTATGDRYAGSPPGSIKQLESAILSWSVANNASSCTGSSTSSVSPNPHIGYWDGNRDPVSGTQNITNTTTKGTYVFTLSCSNAYGTTPASIQLSIIPIRNPYIQTTGGDVHTNESINIQP